jgi:Ca2+-binding EF-hand superfamily protein
MKKAILLFIAYRSNSREEIQAQRKIFLHLDSKKNGFVTINEIKNLLSPHLDQESIQKVFESIDVNLNNQILN